MPPELPEDAQDGGEPRVEEEGETYTVHEEKRYGQRGSETAYELHEETDPETMTKRRVETVTANCECGRATIKKENVYRCVRCDQRACPHCEIRWSKQTFCPSCAKEKWSVYKPTFYALWFVDKDVTNVEDWIDIEFQDEEAVEIAVDHRAAILQDRGYIEEDGSLSPEGREALSVGEAVYSDDDDVEALENKHRIQKVANQE